MSSRRSTRRVKVLIAKIGIDGHDRGAKVIARTLRDAGMEVVYTGLRQTAEQVAMAAVQEDVDVIGVSLHGGSHIYLMSRLMENLRRLGAGDIPVILGGSIPVVDIEPLKRMGVREVFLPGTSMREIVEVIKRLALEGGEGGD